MLLRGHVAKTPLMLVEGHVSKTLLMLGRGHVSKALSRPCRAHQTTKPERQTQRKTQDHGKRGGFGSSDRECATSYARREFASARYTRAQEARKAQAWIHANAHSHRRKGLIKTSGCAAGLKGIAMKERPSHIRVRRLLTLGCSSFSASHKLGLLSSVMPRDTECSIT